MKNSIVKWITAALIAVLLIFLLSWALMRHWYPLPSTASEFGDSFGAANTLFSALAFACLIVTVWMQKRELELQRQELSETRKELQKSAAAQDLSQKALNIQVRIMAKQAMLTAYQSMYHLNIEAARDGNIAIKPETESRSDANTYYIMLKQMLAKLEKESELFSDEGQLDLQKMATTL